MYTIETAGVLGAGTMGAAIAAHLANAGLPVLLLDIVPPLSADGDQPLDSRSTDWRNRVASEGLARIEQLHPPSFMSPAARGLVSLGNLDDDLQQLAFTDWIIEAVVEDLDTKRRLMARLDEVVTSDTIVTTNTSGLPIDSIVENLSSSFRRNFFGTHFFNPPRYMKLLEIIRGSETDQEAVSTIAEVATQRLGKGIVFARDTPNFIANRLLSVHSSEVMSYALENGFRFEEVDAVTGPLIGRPKTATFRLQDLVGIDVAHRVSKNLYSLIPNDPYRETLRADRLEAIISRLIDQGSLGQKSGRGFYHRTRNRDGQPVFLVLDPASLRYQPPKEVHTPALEAVRQIEDLAERLTTLFAEHHRIDDRAAQLGWYAVGRFLLYAADVAPRVAFDLPSVDRAIRWGFSYERGPFELWDALGVATTLERMRSAGWQVASWVDEMLDAGFENFYQKEDGQPTGAYDWNTQSYQPLAAHFVRPDHRRSEVESNASGCLFDLGDRVLLFELRTDISIFDDEQATLLAEALDRLDANEFVGLVVTAGGQDFCTGSSLVRTAKAARTAGIDELRNRLADFQKIMQRIQFQRKPVIAALHGRALGTGAELAIAASRRIAHAETYFGLNQMTAGLLPVGGGLTELVRRKISPLARLDHGVDLLPTAKRILELVATGNISRSAAEARELGLLEPTDRIVMNREHLLATAKSEVLELSKRGFRARASEPIFAAGRDLYSALELEIWSLVQAGQFDDQQSKIAKRIAFVVTGGDASAPSWVSARHFLQCEQQAFLELTRISTTEQQIGQPLRSDQATKLGAQR